MKFIRPPQPQPKAPAVKPDSSFWVLVPVKDLARAKQRLMTCLGDERRGLVLAMLSDLLQALQSSTRVARYVVVTPDEEVAALAAEMGALVVAETGPGGLNSAIRQGLDFIGESGGEAAVILPADIPLLSGAELDRLLEILAVRQAGSEQTVVGLCASADNGGTNLLSLGSPGVFRTHFGKDSFRRHREEAERRHGQPVVLQSEALALDIDSQTDLDRFLDYCRGHPDHQGSKTWQFMRGRSKAPVQAGERPLPELMATAAGIRDRRHGPVITYSRKVFIPLTRLCRDVCHYCTFATMPKHLPAAYMSADEAVELARQGQAMGCKEALFTLGEKPELRHAAAREALAAMGFATTLEYLAHVAGRVMQETGLLPHINAGCMTPEEIAMLRPVSASMGIMLENVSERLCEKGQVHYGSPDKHPQARLATIEAAGRARVPFTTGILIGIGETRGEVLDSLLAIRDMHLRHGHIQEVIVQNFVPKADTKMASVTPPDEDYLLWAIAMARIILGGEVSLQAPPNLNPGRLQAMIEAGINDWGGVSPLTPDHVNPESPWPHLDALARDTAAAGKLLQERLTIYPAFIDDAERWLDAGSRPLALRMADGQGLAREDDWLSGESVDTPAALSLGEKRRFQAPPPTRRIQTLTAMARDAERDLTAEEISHLFTARGADYETVCAAADELRSELCGDVVSYVVNRNINYTNICTYRCGFCAFAKGKKRTSFSEAPYLKSPEEVAGLAREAELRGATEVCLQGGIHPSFTGQTYLDILRAVHEAVPDIHIHAFSPLEVTHGARSLGMPLEGFLAELKQAGLKTLPGTAAEILSDDVRDIICPDKINTQEWLEVLETAHGLGLATTATMMFGHVDRYRHWAIHLLRLLELQRRSGGITEFVPLPFVAREAPIFRRGQARRGPTFREAVLVHAVSRLVLGRSVRNIQTSWVKMGLQGAGVCLQAGANDLGGSLMNESITRAAGARHGQEMTPARLEKLITDCHRQACQRNTLYQTVAA